jgi:hypothetical protein
MKKARIMLAAIAVLGLVGGSLAFRAHRSPVGFYTGTVVGGTCHFIPFVKTSTEGTTVAVNLVRGEGTTKCTTIATTTVNE